ncbi:MAG: GtrA family protein [Alphaproteobacteria bacterium]|nr:GtrA family protein [Alphaproteobacteria bacterium]
MNEKFLVRAWLFVWHLWFKFPQSIRFILVGGFNALFAFCVFCLLVFLIGEQWRQVCLITQWILTSFVSYILHRIFVFQSKGKILEEYIKCCATWIVGYFVNALTLETLFQLGVNVYLAQLISQIVAAFVSYFAFKYWALSKKN